MAFVCVAEALVQRARKTLSNDVINVNNDVTNLIVT